MDTAALTQCYRETDRDCALLWYRIHNHEPYDKELFLPTPEAMDDVRRAYNALRERVNALEEPDNVFGLVKNHLNDFLDSLGFSMEEVENGPEGMLAGFRYQMQHTVRCDRRPDEERCAGLERRIGLLKQNQAALQALLESRPAEGRAKVARALRKSALDMKREAELLETSFPTFTESQIARVRAAIGTLCGEMEEIAGNLSTEAVSSEELLRDDLSRSLKMEGDSYRKLLHDRLGVSLDELLAWHKEEMDRTRSEVFRLASELPIDGPKPQTMQEVSDVLFRYAGPCSSAQEMFDRANGYLKRTRALAHEYVWLPEDETCRCVPLPECYKDSYPWGGYEGGDFSRRPFRGQMFLNQFNYQNITDGWIKMNTMHEAYPGHHVQFERAVTDTTPETVKICAKHVPLEEGICLRTEQAFKFVFEEDPFFPLFVAFRRHHTSTRILVDLLLFYYGEPIEEAVKTYERELGFDRVTARAQVQGHQNSPGYFTCYYYGMKKMCDWEKKYGYGLKEYTEMLFSAGYISMDSLYRYVQLTDAERKRYYTEFASLLMKPVPVIND